MSDSSVRPLVEQARAAWKAVDQALANAKAADKEVEQFLKGKQVLISGYSTGRISGGTVFNDRTRFEAEPMTVFSVFYYFNTQYRNHEDVFRARTSSGVEWQFSVSGTEVVLVSEVSDAT